MTWTLYNWYRRHENYYTVTVITYIKTYIAWLTMVTQFPGENIVIELWKKKRHIEERKLIGVSNETT